MSARVGIQWRYVLRRAQALALPLWFVAYAVVIAYHYTSNGYLGVDVDVYREAARTAIVGGDPWAIQSSGLVFAGPPPTLLFYIPTIFLPLELATALVMFVGVAASFWVVRRLDLPLWWVLFPPVFESILVGNPDVLVLAFLVARGPVGWLAAVLKVYAFVPLILQRRWVEVIVAIIVSALTLPLWPLFMGNLANVVGSLDSQSAGYSAWGTWFIIPTVIALGALRRRGASWLAVPAVWPHTQMHYAAMSLPVVRHHPVAAAIIGLQIPLAAPAAVVLIAVTTRWRARSAADV